MWTYNKNCGSILQVCRCTFCDNCFSMKRSRTRKAPIKNTYKISHTELIWHQDYTSIIKGKIKMLYSLLKVISFVRHTHKENISFYNRLFPSGINLHWIYSNTGNERNKNDPFFCFWYKHNRTVCRRCFILHRHFNK